MPRSKNTKPAKAASRRSNPFELRPAGPPAKETDSQVHVFGKGIVCDTDTRGHATPKGRSPLELVVDASEGFIPLWAKDMTLRWRFRESSMSAFEDPEAAKTEIEKLLGECLLKWDDASPVKFTKRDNAYDFEIVMRESDRCNVNGCVLASAFFPDAGSHELRLYPKLFEQSRQEQIETFIHEIGHVFGLRHFFANVSENAWPSQIFGKHKRFTIMNYGSDSRLTSDDKKDLRKLYQAAWAGELTQVNGTPIRLVKPFHTTGSAPENMLAVGQIQIGVPATSGSR